MTDYFRPIAQTDIACPKEALPIAGGWAWFTHVERLSRHSTPEILPVGQVPQVVLDRIVRPRAPLGSLRVDRPQIMGILNVTPDSFSDGGLHLGPAHALAHAQNMVDAGATFIDVGGESTRPGAVEVPVDDEIERTAPVVLAIGDALSVPVSIDTRKSRVARAALEAGALMVNDVSGLTYDPKLGPLCICEQTPVCVMHALGDPRTMQDNPEYDDVLLDVFDFLNGQIEALEAQGLSRDKIVVDPGIGFGKTQDHNLALLARLSLFHSLGCVVLVGASRKRFIGTIGNTQDAAARVPGSVAVALEAIAQGAQIVRVHDVAETRQALSLWRAVTTGGADVS